ncbi:MAG: hypothetical protein GTN69_03050 [Armatimonadetes bacterium]|nr:hypothetical protein [Armatimonadota bacterium]NIO74875.1 hypothetical protein [Armatimonadota bacterium]NIO95636.1 hypothetical protein [Armatimonadota bacterium]
MRTPAQRFHCFLDRRALRWLTVILLSMTVAFTPALAKDVELRQLTNDGRSYLEFGSGCAPAGDRVAHYREVTEASRELCVLDLKSGKTQKVSGVGYPFSAVWSPDGSKLAFLFANAAAASSEATLMVWDAATGKTSPTAQKSPVNYLFSDDGLNRPYWSPDNAHLAIRLWRGDEQYDYSSVFVIPVDGGARVELAPNNATNFFSETHLINVWSPDGSRIAFIGRDASGLSQVWTSDPKGLNLKALTKPIDGLWGLAWSYDGRQIAFTSSEGRLEDERERGYSDVWVMNADGSNQHPLTDGSARAIEHRTYWMIFNWTKDSRYVMAWFGKPDEKADERYNGFDFIDAHTGEIVNAYTNDIGTSDSFQSWNYWADSWDGKRFAQIGSRYTVRGLRGGEQTREDRRSILRVFSLTDRKMVDLITYRPEQDRIEVVSAPSWTPDDRHLVVTRRRIISAAENRYESDLYLVTLPWAKEAEKPAAPPTDGVQPEVPGEKVECAGMVELFVQHRRAAEAAELLPAAHGGTFTIDENRNALLVAEDAPNLEALRKCLTAVDRNVPHIMVDVLVTELSKEANKELGLDWEFARSRFGGMLPFGPESTPGYMLWQGVGQLDEKFIGTLSMLAQKGEATVRANPRVLATSGKEASITIRRTDFFLYTSGVDWEGRPVRSRSDISADTILKITPILLGDGRISVQVDATVDSFTFVGRDDLPDTTRRQAVTDVICSEGESIIIGGLTQQERATTLHKTPILGDLPLLGPLFRHTRDQSRESTLVMFITPRLSAPGVVHAETAPTQ